MFDFMEPEDGSEQRFHERQENWRNGTPAVVETRAVQEAARGPGRRMPLAQHYAWWLVHNLVAHPAIGLLPIKPMFNFHDWTSRKLNGF